MLPEVYKRRKLKKKKRACRKASRKKRRNRTFAIRIRALSLLSRKRFVYVDPNTLAKGNVLVRLPIPFETFETSTRAMSVDNEETARPR